MASRWKRPSRAFESGRAVKRRLLNLVLARRAAQRER